MKSFVDYAHTVEHDAAIEYGLLIYNPALGIKPPRTSTHPAETITYLEQDEANRLLQGIDHRNELKLVRDRLLLGLMTIEGTRTVELYRCNLEDIKRLGKDVGLKLGVSVFKPTDEEKG